MDTQSKDYKELSCRDFRADCDFMVRAETADEVAKFCQEHACSVHGKCGTSTGKIRSRIKDVRVYNPGLHCVHC